VKVHSRVPVNIKKAIVPKGQVFLIPERCKGCRICIRFCPQDVLQESESVNARGYHLPEVKIGRESDCVHCEFCSLVCPEFAIFTIEVEE
jgi:2-oxoglutarate ferredoxin oxidoreductase subunit delta